MEQQECLMNRNFAYTNIVFPGVAANDANFEYRTDFGVTGPDTGFFMAFRFYGPLEGYIEKT
jgi:hypothetical protein